MMPPTRDDPVLGPLTYDAGLGWYAGETLWSGARVRCQLSGETAEEIEGAAAAARRLFAEPERWRAAAEAAAAEQLVSIKNEHWRDPSEAVLTAAEFIRRMTPESIVFYADGTVELAWDDGGLFHGHLILVSLDMDSGEFDASFAG